MIRNLKVYITLHRSTMLANLVAPCVPCFHNETVVDIRHSIASDRCRSEILFTTKFVGDLNHRINGIAGLFLKFQCINVDHGRSLHLALQARLQGEPFHLAALSNNSQFTLIFLFTGPTLDWFINIVSPRNEVMTQVLAGFSEHNHCCIASTYPIFSRSPSIGNFVITLSLLFYY